MMIKITAEQLIPQLKKTWVNCYLLAGSEPLLLKESQDALCAEAISHGYQEQVTFIIDHQTPWQEILFTCQEVGLFVQRKRLILHFSERSLTNEVNEHLSQLARYLTSDIVLILLLPKLNRTQEKMSCFSLLKHALFVRCDAPEPHQLLHWLARRAAQLHLQLDPPVMQQLCFYYEGNLLALVQTLEKLALLYPEGKLTLPRIEQCIDDMARFTPFHWIDAILSGKTQRTLHILKQLEAEESEVIILIRLAQKELFLLLTLKQQMVITPLNILFDQQKIWQYRRALLTSALQRLSLQEIQQAVHLLNQIEIMFKQDYNLLLWPQLQMLSLLLCGMTPLIMEYA